ncbi:MAG: GAF domain-containing protein [Myxococcota bacterium]
MEYTITALNGDSVKVESENWMTAMGKALAFFDIDIGSIGRLTCSPARDGSVFIEDPSGARSWMVRQHAPDIAIRVTPRAIPEKWEPLRDPDPVSEEEPAPRMVRQPPPPVAMPTAEASSLRTQTRTERELSLATELAGANLERGAELLLDAINEYVRGDAACVAIGTLQDPALRVVAARGPLAGSILGRQVGFGEGLIGMCFDMRGTLLVNDVASDTMHLDQLDRDLDTLAVMCAPLLDEDGTAQGVVQLVNPPERAFTQAHVEVVEAFSRVLASALAVRAG